MFLTIYFGNEHHLNSSENYTGKTNKYITNPASVFHMNPNINHTNIYINYLI